MEWLLAISEWFHFAAQRLPELWFRTGQHLLLTGVSTLLAVAIGLPLGIVASASQSLRPVLLAIIGIFQTIPSLAMLAVLLTLVGKIGAVPAIIALTIYALLPIVRNTVTAIEGVPPEAIEAARGMGMSRLQQLRMVQLPLASPVIVAGIRTAAVVGVGIATLSAFIGAGGLGQFINRGLALSNTQLILLGAIPAAMLAVTVDALIAGMAWGLKPVRQRERSSLKARLKPVAFAAPLLFAGLGVYAAFDSSATESSRSDTVRIGSKNFTEQLILAEIMAQMIEAHSDLSVDRRFNLGGTMICHEALRAGEIDLYAEYTGTGLVTVLKELRNGDADAVFARVKDAYLKRYGLTWLAPFGFNNTYALTVRQSIAEDRGWQNISDLSDSAENLRAGFTAEFAERADGYPGLRNAYGLRFGTVKDLEPSLMYEAVANDEVDVICAFTTDGRIAAYSLKSLIDDRQFFPPYFAAPVVRSELQRQHPEVGEILGRLERVIDDVAMLDLNYQVDVNGKLPAEVARDFLVGADLLKNGD